VAALPMTGFVDTSHPHTAKDHIRLGEMKQFRKAALGGGTQVQRRSFGLEPLLFDQFDSAFAKWSISDYAAIEGVPSPYF
jgi:hypothetical protein